MERLQSCWARTLTAITTHAECAGVAHKRDLTPGDRVVVSTRNSVYSLESVGGELFLVHGGWFEKNPGSRLITVNGCTYGGSVIRTDIVAAPGLFLEFGNNVSTTRIQSVRVLRGCRTCVPDSAWLPN
jgi:hypothetical protein